MACWYSGCFQMTEKALMRSPALGFLDPVKYFELFPHAKAGSAVCEQSELQSCRDLKPEYSTKIQLIRELYSKFHPGGWAVTPAGQGIVSEGIKQGQRLSNVETLLEIIGKLALQNFHAKRAVNFF